MKILPSIRNRKQIGNLAENIAKYYLKIKLFKILDSNYNEGRYEIDIIAYKKKDIYFIEVKSCNTCGIEFLSDKMDFKKQERIKKAALHYITAKDLEYDQIYFSVIFIRFSPFYIEFIKQAF